MPFQGACKPQWLPRVSLRLPWAMRLCPFRAHVNPNGYPGCRFACPGLCARWAFSPPLLNQGVPMIIPRVSLRLPWAKEVIGLSARLVCFCHILITGPANDYFTQSRATPSEAKLTIRCESRLRPELLDVMRSSNHSKCRMSLFLSCSCPLFLSVPFWGEGGEALRLSDF